MCSTDRCLSGAIKSLLRASHAKSGISRAGHVGRCGFRVDRVDTGYIPGPRIMTFLYEGAATPR